MTLFNTMKKNILTIIHWISIIQISIFKMVSCLSWVNQSILKLNIHCELPLFLILCYDIMKNLTYGMYNFVLIHELWVVLLVSIILIDVFLKAVFEFAYHVYYSPSPTFLHNCHYNKKNICILLSYGFISYFPHSPCHIYYVFIRWIKFPCFHGVNDSFQSSNSIIEHEQARVKL